MLQINEAIEISFQASEHGEIYLLNGNETFYF